MMWLIASAAAIELPQDVPTCGAHTQAAAFFTGKDLRQAPPPSDDSSLPTVWSMDTYGDVVIMRDMTGGEFGGRDGLDYDGMYSALQTFYGAFPDEFDFVTVLTHEDNSSSMGALAFYSPLSNNVSGIGQRTYSSGMELEGLLFMNSWQYWYQYGDVFTSAVFGQELGHRWGAYVNYQLVGENVKDDNLGRADGHWSYWLDSSNSPMEGNTWIDNGDGSFTIDADEEIAYSDLDLYLMGFIPPEDVAPFFLIDDPSGLNRNASSPPEYYNSGQDKTCEGERIDITIDDIVRAEGERRPLAENSQRDFTMAVILVLDQDENLTAPIVSGVQAVEARFERVWEEDVFDLATLDISTAGVELPAPDPVLGEPVLVPRSVW